jgi:four helix bundle protein
MHNYRELDVWKEAILLAKEPYILIQKFPKDELFGLISRIRKCVVSIPSNTAEASGRDTLNDFNPFLAIATGSSFELDTQLILSNEFGYITDEQLNPILEKLKLFKKCYTV